MQKLDRLGWAEGIAFRAYGWKLGIRYNQPGVRFELEPFLPPVCQPLGQGPVELLYSLWIAPPSTRRGIVNYNLLHVQARHVARHTELQPVLELLRRDLRLTLSMHSRSKTFIHAGVVGWKGRAILIPGDSSYGKSTLVEQLVARGATYFSDEYAVICKDGRVEAYPDYLAHKVPGMGDVLVSPESLLPSRKLLARLPIGMVLQTRFKEGAEWRPRRMSPARVLLKLFRHAPHGRHNPQDVVGTLKSIKLDQVVGLSGSRGEASEVAERILAAARW